MTLNVAVVGTGDFARKHLLALKDVPGVRVTHVAGSSMARASALAGLVPGAKASTDIAAVVSAPEVDAVDVCNATHEHARWTIAAGRAGKHVHVDKPATLSLPLFDAMVEAVEGNGRTLMVGQTVRFQPAVVELRRALQHGDVGEPRLLHVSWYTGHAWPGGWRAWQFDTQKSGGQAVHNGVHSIDLAIWLMGSPPIEVFARDLPTFAAQMPMPDSFHVQLRFANGGLASLEHCYALKQPGSSIRRVVLAATSGTLVHDSETDTGLSAPGHPQPVVSVEGALNRQLTYWTELVRGKQPPIVTTGQARMVLATALAAQESLATGRPVAVEREVAA